MGTFRFFGLLAIIPTTILLTISFFVLFANRKVEQQNLKTFGTIIAVLLWLSAALVFSTGIYSLSTGGHCMKHGGWGMGMGKGQPCPQMQENMGQKQMMQEKMQKMMEK